ncbi:MAG: glycosyltransferase family 39 protein [Pyrinomonadaceae bacterium]
MNRSLAIIIFLVGVALLILTFPDGLGAGAVLVLVSSIVLIIIRQTYGEDSDYLIRLFFIALIVRLLFGVLVHVFELRDFFGPDANTYDDMGWLLNKIWFENAPTNNLLSQRALATSGSGWGMSKLVAFIYMLTGRNILAAQSLCAVIGAATVPMIYSCAVKIFNNRRVGQISALMVALSPAFIIWTGQLLKDGLIIFLLVMSMTIVLKLQEKFSYWGVFFLILSLFGIFSLRFYIFFMAALAIVGSLLIGTNLSFVSMFRRGFVLIILGLSLTYFGIIKNAGTEFEQYGSLERIQVSRSDLAKSAESGYGEDLDVSTTSGAILALPVGFIYLMFAPFPWQITNLRQLVAFPEVLLWWMSMPFLVSGLIYAAKTHLRKAIPVIVFSILLTLGYSIFVGNVGTAYRQRTQIQVFLFIFVAVGWTLREEKLENKKILSLAKKKSNWMKLNNTGNRN